MSVENRLKASEIAYDPELHDQLRKPATDEERAAAMIEHSRPPSTHNDDLEGV